MIRINAGPIVAAESVALAIGTPLTKGFWDPQNVAAMMSCLLNPSATLATLMPSRTIARMTATMSISANRTVDGSRCQRKAVHNQKNAFSIGEREKAAICTLPNRHGPQPVTGSERHQQLTDHVSDTVQRDAASVHASPPAATTAVGLIHPW